ncbi:MAG: redoxin domain-containing protein [Planctomycetes bacterium]|nr:redoxin domain-containing protein [Planctomycetota bacterium]
MRTAGLAAGVTLAALVAGGPAWSAPPGARVGDVAPVFTLNDVADRPHSLEQHRGKIVVLEWYNPDCPAVKRHHQRAKTMKELAAKYKDRDVVWLAINSGAPGKQGHGQERNARSVREYEIEYPVLLDPSGEVGRAYGARVTPHMFVIDRAGKLVYAGAIDDEGKAGVNYVEKAVEALLADEPVERPETRAYG